MAKSRYIGVRLEPAQWWKLKVLSLQTKEPGSTSEALRWLLDHTPMPNGTSDVRPDIEAEHA